MSFTFLFTIFLLSGIIIWLFIKQKKVAFNLDMSNKNYQLLLIKSNHTIKNNLQMILSMVNHSNDKLSLAESKALNNISNKIQVVSALYRQINIDLKSEYISLPLYFEEIISLNTALKRNAVQVEKEIYPLKINSDRIVYFGLILNELFANTIEHNLSEIKKIHLKIKKIDNYFVFEYCNNSTYIETEEIGKGVLLHQLVKRIKGTNCLFDKKTGKYTFHFNDVN